MNILRHLVLLACLGAGIVSAQQAPAGRSFIDAARGPTSIPESTKPPPLANAVNDDVRRTRSHPAQPPVIPHRVDGYQVDKSFNKCLDCHARTKTETTQAIPISATHYMDRNGRVLAQVSTRRYFCMQCHVAQENARPIVQNNFQDVDTLIQRAMQQKSNDKGSRK